MPTNPMIRVSMPRKKLIDLEIALTVNALARAIDLGHRAPPPAPYSPAWVARHTNAPGSSLIGQLARDHVENERLNMVLMTARNNDDETTMKSTRLQITLIERRIKRLEADIALIPVAGPHIITDGPWICDLALCQLEASDGERLITKRTVFVDLEEIEWIGLEEWRHVQNDRPRGHWSIYGLEGEVMKLGKGEVIARASAFMLRAVRRSMKMNENTVLNTGLVLTNSN
jgi:hypothetical protein